MSHTPNELCVFYDRITMVKESAKPPRQIREIYGGAEGDDWYHLLRGFQGEPEKLFTYMMNDKPVFMTDGNLFIKDSLWCEYAYIINLDTNVLEYYEGFQTEPDPDGRYGQECSCEYYPCKKVLEIPLDKIVNADEIVGAMKYSSIILGGK